MVESKAVYAASHFGAAAALHTLTTEMRSMPQAAEISAT